MVDIEIVFSQHVMDQMIDRGTSDAEIKLAIRDGEEVPAKKERKAYRKNFPFESYWKGKYYFTKQVVPVIKEELGKIVVITVYVFYFGGKK
jgi:predicted RNA-binding protein with RPS1 domain